MLVGKDVAKVNDGRIGWIALLRVGSERDLLERVR